MNSLQFSNENSCESIATHVPLCTTVCTYTRRFELYVYFISIVLCILSCAGLDPTLQSNSQTMPLQVCLPIAIALIIVATSGTGIALCWLRRKRDQGSKNAIVALFQVSYTRSS